MSDYNELLSELLELEELWKNWLLKGSDWSAFDKQMRELDISNDGSIDKITKAKFEQRQNKIHTLYTSTRTWLMWSEFLWEWKEFLELFCWERYTKKQIYFPPESEEKILEELWKLFKSAKSYIQIYDNYFSNTFLSLFTGNLKHLKIEVITNTKIQDLNTLINAFKLMNPGKTIEIRKYNFAHDRFYIIDNSIYSLWTSLQKTNRATLFSKLEKEEGEKFISDFNEWWSNSKSILINES